MKRNLTYLIISVWTVLMLFSCSHEVDYLKERGEGLLRFNVGYDLGVEQVTKSEAEPVFVIKIINLNTGIQVKQYADHRTLADSPVALREGRYAILAESGKDIGAGFEAPYYKGADTIDVQVGKEVSANIICTLANVKVTVAVSDTLRKYFSDYFIEIDNGAPDGKLKYSKNENTLSSVGYFRATGDLFWTISLTNTDGRTNVLSGKVKEKVKPRQYYNFTFHVTDDGSSGVGGTSLVVTLDGTLVEQEHDIDISLNKDPAPVIREQNIQDLSTTINVPKEVGAAGLFMVSSAAGVQQVTIAHTSDVIEALGVPKNIDVLNTLHNHYAAQGLTWTEGVTEGTIAFDIDFRKMFSEVLELGTYHFKINVLDRQSQYVSQTFTVKIVPNSDVTTVKIEPWAKFAYAYAQYNSETEPEGMGFQYKKKADAEWTTYAGNLAKDGVSYSAKITGLDPSTEYEFRAVTAEQQKDENIMTVTTEAADQLPNFNFDQWYQDGKNWYAAPDMSNVFWDSGNVGANTISAKNPTSPEESKVIAGKAVKMETMAIVGVMAGGNIYSGSFGEVVGMSGAKVNFGRPYTCRPLALHGYYAYTPVNIDKVKSPWESLKGEKDTGKIFVVLADWPSPFVVDNSKDPMQLFDPSDSGVIAYGELEDNVGTPNGDYKEFTIELEYRDYNRKPTHVIVVACASKLADYFTGGVGSVMYVDEFEFIFE